MHSISSLQFNQNVFLRSRKNENIFQNLSKSNVALEFDEKLLKHLHELELKPFAEDDSTNEKENFFRRNSMLSLLNCYMFDGSEVIGPLRAKRFF